MGLLKADELLVNLIQNIRNERKTLRETAILDIPEIYTEEQELKIIDIFTRYAIPLNSQSLQGMFCYYLHYISTQHISKNNTCEIVIYMYV